MTNIKKAALFIHSLDLVDQQWLLSQLDARQQDVVAASLDELQQHGLTPEDAALLFAECDARVTVTVAAVEPENGIETDDLAFEGVDIDSVVRVLRNEHPAVAAAVLGQHEALLKRVVLARLPSRHQRQTMTLATQAKWSSRVRDVAVQRVREVAEDDARERATGGPFYWLREALR